MNGHHLGIGAVCQFSNFHLPLLNG
jgi:hypothetical protein